MRFLHFHPIMAVGVACQSTGRNSGQQEYAYMNNSVLIIEADPRRRALFSDSAERAGFAIETVDVEDDLPTRFPETLLTFSQILLGDVPHDAALAFLRELGAQPSAPPVIAFTCRHEVAAQQELFKSGAAEVLENDPGSLSLVTAMRRVLDVARLTSDLSRIKGHRNASIRLDDFKSASTEVQRAVALAERAVSMEMHVLLEGEAGVGRCLLARAIHAESGRSAQAFEQIDCSGFTGDDVTACLFDKPQGAYWRARGGSLLLNEVAALPENAQHRLAEMVQTPHRSARQIMNDNNPQVRLFATSSRDMIPLVKSGAFRADLFYPLNVCPIWLPPLRVRREDISRLAEGFAMAFALETGKRVERLSPDACALLKRYDWPGNLLELEREVFRAVLLADGSAVEPAHFPRIAAEVGNRTAASQRQLGGISASAPQRRARQVENAPALVEGMPLAKLANHEIDNGSVGIPALTAWGELRSLEEIEADMIRLALGRYRGSMTKAARQLGIGRSTLYRKMREFGITNPGAPR